MDGALLRNRPFDPIQKMQKLLVTMARLALRDDRSFDNVQGGKQRSRSMPTVVVRLVVREGPGAAATLVVCGIQRLNLALLIHTL